jgi:hypothetical protein
VYVSVHPIKPREAEGLTCIAGGCIAPPAVQVAGVLGGQSRQTVVCRPHSREWITTVIDAFLAELSRG